MKLYNRIILIGYRASGKTTVGQLIAEKMEWKFNDTDWIIENDTGSSLPYFFKTFGESAFRNKEYMVLKDLLDLPIPQVISNVKNWAPNALLVGFKLLVNSNDVELIENAKKSIVDNKCDMVVANDLRDIKNNDHRLIIVKSDLSVTFHNSDKNDPNYLARKVIQTIKELK